MSDAQLSLTLGRVGETKVSESVSSATRDRFCTSALKPIERSPSSVCNRNDLDTLAKHPIDDEKRKSTQQKASGVTDVRRRGFGSFRNQSYGSIELASKTCRRGLVPLAVPPHCRLGFVGGERVDFDRERSH